MSTTPDNTTPDNPITDKQRLDWLERTAWDLDGIFIEPCFVQDAPRCEKRYALAPGTLWGEEEPSAPTLREAIDNAMKKYP